MNFIQILHLNLFAKLGLHPSSEFQKWPLSKLQFNFRTCKILPGYWVGMQFVRYTKVSFGAYRHLHLLSAALQVLVLTA
jgi:hypothetical protein